VSKVFLKDYNAVWKGGSLTLSALVDGQADEVRVRVLDGGEGYDPETGRPGACVGETSIVPGSESTVAISSPQLWSPEHPYLYAMEFKVYAGGKLMEKVKGYTALREVAEVRDSAGNRRIGLNGEPYFQFGPLDQGWWPDGLYTAPSDDALRFDIEKTREFGFNMIRKHIKVEPARWYTWCDRLGIVVWQDMPSLAANLPGGQWGEWGYETGWDYPLTETAKDTYYKEWGEIIAQLKKYPSIVVWVPFNEAWSQFDTGKAVDFTRKQDPTRLINSASGGNSYHVGDILDSHNYPNPRMKFRSGGTQIDVLGEYGGIGLAVDGHMWQSRGSWGYQGLCSSPEEVLERYTAFAEEFIPDVESGVAAGVYTQTTDVEVEVNGLMTYDRKVIKMDVEKLRAVNQRIISAAK
jgi:beta-galactosidase/beta-glucuronidase